MNSNIIKILLFDLGGVIIDLHVERTIEQFAHLSGKTEAEVLEKYLSASYFQDFEMGLISDHQFREALKKDLKVQVNDEQFDKAWSAMLGDISLEVIEEIKQLTSKYHCAVLSNTNAIHEKAFHTILKDAHGYLHLNELFKSVHFSHEMNLRKPNENIYLEVMKIHQTEAAQILFLDDTLPNLDTAGKLGYHTLHIPRNQGFKTLLSDKINLNDRKKQ